MAKQSSISEEYLQKVNSLPVLNNDTFSNLKKQTQSQPELLKEIFDSFFEDVNEMIAGLKDSVTNQDFQVYTTTLHTLKGLSGTIGASRLFELTNCIYTKARMNDFSLADDSIPLLHKYILELEEEIKMKF
jgi:HPt (histidine-containing phosphotransfer) domain-containing protein